MSGQKAAPSGSQWSNLKIISDTKKTPLQVVFFTTSATQLFLGLTQKPHTFPEIQGYI